MLEILTAPHIVLSRIAQPVKKVDKSISRLIEEMKKTLLATTDPEGIGLAAPQVGKSLSLFIVKEGPKAPFSVFINPVIKHFEDSQKGVFLPAKKPKTIKNKKKNVSSNVKLEGCLSLPRIWGEVLRHPSAAIRYLDENARPHTKIYYGFFATIIQHEYDHLQGILFPKRVLEQGGKLYKQIRKENEDEFEEIEI